MDRRRSADVFPREDNSNFTGNDRGSRPRGSSFAFTFIEKQPDGHIRFHAQSRLVDWWLRRRSEPFLWAATRDEIRELLRFWSTVVFFDHTDLRALGKLPPTTELAVGEIICLATR